MDFRNWCVGTHDRDGTDGMDGGWRVGGVVRDSATGLLLSTSGYFSTDSTSMMGAT